jgi:DNA-binding NarL/FixJ family response regulator
MNKLGFILVIDSYLVRKGMVSLLNQIRGVKILKEFNNPHSLATYLAKQPADFLIICQSLFDESMDLFIKQPGLLEKTILLQEGFPGSSAPLASGSQVQATINLKEEKEKIVEKIQGLLEQSGLDKKDPQAVRLSPRETTIVKLVSMGLTNQQIADSLFLSAHTVMTHRKNISSKLGIKSVSGLTVYAIVNNIITIEEVTSKPEQ